MRVNTHLPDTALHAAPARRARVCFLYLAQAHHVLHSLSVALELARRRPDLEVDVAAASEGVFNYARLLADSIGGSSITWRLLGPAWLRKMGGGDGIPPKIPMLAASARTLGGYDVIIAPERTTAALRGLGVRAGLVYTQHGAGDRAGPFEPRLARFDLVFAAGPKQRDRMVAEGLVAPHRCVVVGYPKFDLVDALAPALPRLFANDRPTVLYNPHFSAKLGSWGPWGGRILRAFAGQSQYNLIFAPHLRLFGGADPRHVKDLAPFVGHPGIHIDLGTTPAAVDMTYTRLANLYLGDVSSQVYEFLREPRPCLFLNPHHAPWRANESYGHWNFGAVLDSVGDLLPALGSAFRTHGEYRTAQIQGFHHTFDLAGPPASIRAADAIAWLADNLQRTRDRSKEDASWTSDTQGPPSLPPP